MTHARSQGSFSPSKFMFDSSPSTYSGSPKSVTKITKQLVKTLSRPLVRQGSILSGVECVALLGASSLAENVMELGADRLVLIECMATRTVSLIEPFANFYISIGDVDVEVWLRFVIEEMFATQVVAASLIFLLHSRVDNVSDYRLRVRIIWFCQNQANQYLLMFEKVAIHDIQNYYSQPVGDRYQALLARFQQLYQLAPDFIARAPGRVNIIGEHIDYEGYGVLPAAIEKDCLIAVKKVDSDSIKISHMLSEKFPDCELSKNPEQISESVKHSYAKYFAAGYRAGILDLVDSGKVTGLQILIQGNIPWAAGVSSSSAFCVCSALCSYFANEVKEIANEEFVERCIKFEREVGTASGGMDQSISVLGKINSCLHIQFNPIRGDKVSMPSQKFRFIIMNSLVESAKMETAIFRYNKRVCECRLSVWLLAKALGIKREVYNKWTVLKDLQEWAKLQLHQMLNIVSKFLKNQPYTKAMLEQELGCPLLEVVGDITRAQQVLEANEEFAIYQAAFHVYSQSQRVRDFVAVCSSPLEDIPKAHILGELMNQSQDSCRDLYHCSCPQLDELTKLACEHGALGSRLTGAGWGGCTVSLVPAEKVQEFKQKMQQTFYSKPELKAKVEELGLNNVMFATQPCEGAFIILI